MSTELWNVIKNIEYRVEAITPTYQGMREPFQSVNGIDISPETLAPRQFHVDMSGTQQKLDISDGTHRTTVATYLVTVYYPSEHVTPNELWQAITTDQKDIIRDLENPSKYVGYSGSTSAACGIDQRNCITTRVQQMPENGFWALELTLLTQIQEQY